MKANTMHDYIPSATDGDDEPPTDESGSGQLPPPKNPTSP